MMGNYNNYNNNEQENGGCRFQGQGRVQEQIEVQAPVQSAPAATIQVVAPSTVKTVTPVK